MGAPIRIQVNDPTFGRVPRSAVRNVLAGHPCRLFYLAARKNVNHGWQEESDATTTKVYA